MNAHKPASGEGAEQPRSPAKSKRQTPARMWILEEVPPTSAPVAVLPDSVSIADEAAKLLDIGARVADRLNVLQMAEQMIDNSSAFPSNSPRQRAAKLRVRMNKFSSIYNAAWMVRHYQRTSLKGLENAINDFCVVLARELERAADKEALLYAVAESLTISPYGVPWEC